MEGINTPFVIDEHTAIVMTDPQNDFLSENGLMTSHQRLTM